MNRKINVSLFAAFLCVLGSPIASDAQDRAVGDAATRPGTASPSKMVWFDEFDDGQLDYSKWGVEQNAFGGGNGELQIYTDRKENVRVEAGCLVLETHRDNAGVSGTVREYSSGRVRTKHRGDWKYGRIEVRAKLPTGQGIWPAIWMLPTDEVYGSWAASGEIDIMEMRGQQPSIVLGTLHHGDKWPNNIHTGSEFNLLNGTFADDFHVFAVQWREGEISWFVDDVMFQTQADWKSSGGTFPAPFDQRFHLILNLAVGGGFVGPPDATTQFPQRMLIDYVRVFQ